MKRRGIAAYTHIGGGGPSMLSNEGNITNDMRAMFNEAIELYFQKWEGCDYQITKDAIEFGVEPSYQYEDLKIISLNKIKDESYIATGYAFGAWGSAIRGTTKYYRDYRRSSKFTKFINNWHPIIYGVSSSE